MFFARRNNYLPENSIQLLERHKKAFYTSLSKRLFSSCIMLLWKQLELVLSKCTEDACFRRAMKIELVDLNVPLVFFFARTRCQEKEPILKCNDCFRNMVLLLYM